MHYGDTHRNAINSQREQGNVYKNKLCYSPGYMYYYNYSAHNIYIYKTKHLYTANNAEWEQ